MEIIHCFFKGKIKLLTMEHHKSYKNAQICYICKKKKRKKNEDKHE